ncbi:MAG: hypothetical protein O2817_09835 [Proteobacteria bacterium]|nr:hypothetical protein [Pseudomonadota bacterium]
MTDKHERDRRDEWTTMSRVLLGGYISEGDNGFSSSAYLPEGDYQIECRRALAMLLNSGNPPKDILRLLARLFEPDDCESASERTLVFKFRRKGRRRDHHYRSAIAQKVADALKTEKTVEVAIASVAKELGGTEDTELEKEESVRKIWQAYKPFYDAGVI